MTDPLRRMNPATVTRDLYEAQGEPLPGPLGRMSKQDTMKKRGLDYRRSWQKETQLAIAEGSGGSGGSSPDWVPADAVIYIDLVNNRAWTSTDGEVAIDTLLGADANTENGWSTSGYDPEALVAEGYVEPLDPVMVPALIGSARTMMLAGATIRVKLRFQDETASALNNVALALLSADGADAIEVDLGAAQVTRRLSASSWGGSASQEQDDVANGPPASSLNFIAATITSTRLEVAANGITPFELTLDATDRPPGNPLVAVVIESALHALQTITFYDALPDTTGLSALSETGVTNTTPTYIGDEFSLATTLPLPIEDDPYLIGSCSSLFADAEGNPLTLSIHSTDGDFSIDNSGGLGLVYFVTGGVGAGAYDYTIRATDPGGLYVEHEFTVTVTS